MDSLHNTTLIGKVLHHLPKAESTNRIAQNMLKDAKKPPGEGTAILTYNQTAGRGQLGSSWYSESGKNIAISVLLFPILKAQNHFFLNMAMTVGILHFVKDHLGEGTSIKWPNDIFYKNQKIAGLLMENAVTGQNLHSAVIGAGINVNQENFPNLPHASSFKNSTGKSYNLDSLVEPLCLHLEEGYNNLMQQPQKVLKCNYMAHLYRFNEWHTYKDATGYFTARIKNVGDDGKLWLENKEHIIKVYDLKEVHYCL